MLIHWRALDALLPPRRARNECLHVGAHLAEEAETYRKLGIGHRTWVESNPELVATLSENPALQGDSILQACAWEKSGVELSFNINSNSQTSSVFSLGTARERYPEILGKQVIKLNSVALQDVLPSSYEPCLIALDIQGAELQALRGMSRLLTQAHIVYSEVHREEIYVGCSQVSEIDAFMAEYGFRRVVTVWTDHNWGDAIYAKNPNPSRLLIAWVFRFLGQADSRRRNIRKRLDRRLRLSRRWFRRKRDGLRARLR